MTITFEHSMRALDRANAVRLERARLRKSIAAGQTTIADVLRDPPDEARAWPIAHLLCAQRRWGPRTARRFLAEVDPFGVIGELRHVGALTDRQRLLLVEALS